MNTTIAEDGFCVCGRRLNDVEHLPDGTTIIWVERAKYGRFPCYLGTSDYDQVKGFYWSLVKGRNTLYTQTGGKGRSKQLMHRLFLPASPIIDHRDNNGLNNRRDNLRAATCGQNIANTNAGRRAASGYRGVSRRGNRFIARITFNFKDIHLGSFDTAIDAAKAYDAAALRYFGEFARLNFPDDARVQAAA
jgi:AP2 domain